MDYETRDLTRQAAALLRGLMARYDVSQRDLANSANLSQSQVSKILRGVKPVTVDELNAMCFALGTDASTLLTEAHNFIRGIDSPIPARFIYVDEGLRLAEPYDTSDWGSESRIDLPTSKRATRSNVTSSKNGEDPKAVEVIFHG